MGFLSEILRDLAVMINAAKKINPWDDITPPLTLEPLITTLGGKRWTVSTKGGVEKLIILEYTPSKKESVMKLKLLISNEGAVGVQVLDLDSNPIFWFSIWGLDWVNTKFIFSVPTISILRKEENSELKKDIQDKELKKEKLFGQMDLRVETMIRELYNHEFSDQSDNEEEEDREDTQEPKSMTFIFDNGAFYRVKYPPLIF
jgi:hypothetical protein